MYSYEANGRGNTSATDAKLLERKSQFINLPAVTPEDDGKVLGVNNGKWQPVDGGGSVDPAVENAKETSGFGWTESGEKIYYAEGQTISLANDGSGELQKKDGASTVEQIYNAGIRNVTIVIDGESVNGYVSYDDDGDYYYINAYKDSYSIQITDNSAGQYRFYYYAKRNANVTVEFYYAPVILHQIDSKYMPLATVGEAGMVRKAFAVAEAQGGTVTGAEFNQLLYALQSAGIVAYSYE